MKTHSLYIIAVLLMFASCTKMNDNIKDYLDRGEVNYLGRPGANYANGGLNKIALNWVVDDDPRITGAIITYTDLKNVEQKIEVPIDRSQLQNVPDVGNFFRTVIDPIEEGTYVFKIQHTSSDKANQHSLYTEISGRVYGPVYLEGLRTRGFIGQAVHLGNGTIMQWSSQDGQSCLIKYKNYSGDETEMTFTNFKEQVILTDYHSGNIYYEMTILSDPNAMEPFVVKDTVRVDEKTRPFTRSAPIEIGIADFDLGGEGKAYHDTDPGNSGGVTYRDGLGDADGGGVDLQGDGILNIGYTNADEWLNYTVYVQEAGLYHADMLASVNGDGKTISFKVDGNDVTGPITLLNDRGWGNYAWQSEKDPQAANDPDMPKAYLDLTAGFHTITFYENTGGYNVRSLRFTPVDVSLIRQTTFDVGVGEQGDLSLAYQVAGKTDVDVVWTSSNPAIATVNEGTVTGVSGGVATITATCGSYTGTCTVTVGAKVDKGSWSVPGYQDAYGPQIGYNTQEAGGEGASPNGRVIALFDDNYDTFWHSRWNGVVDWTFPCWAIIDMGEEVEIGKIVTTRRANNNNGKTVTYYLSNTPLAFDAPEWGAPIGTSVFSTFRDYRKTSIEILQSGVKGRYLMIYCPDTYNNHICISEIDVYRY